MFLTWLRALIGRKWREASNARRWLKHSRWRTIKLYAEALEDRLAPANVLMWTGADANMNLIPGLLGNYFKNNESTAQFVPANVSNVNWIGNATPLTPTGFSSPNVPILGTINFPSIGTNGAKSFTSADGLTTVVTRTTNVEARWFGYVNVPNNGKTGNPISFRIRSDDASVLTIDNTLVVNNDATQTNTTRGATINLSPGMHLIDVEYGQGSGPGAMTAQWDPQGGSTFADIADGVDFFYNSSPSGNINWSDANNWVVQGTSTHALPNNGDTLVFSSNATTNPGFMTGAYTSNNDLANLTLNGIVIDASGGGAFTLNGNGVTLTLRNTNQTNTAGISYLPAGDATFVPTSIINLASGGITLGSNATITNSAAPMPPGSNIIPGSTLAGAVAFPSLTNQPVPASTVYPAYTNVQALVPSLVISAKIDLAGFGLTEGPNGANPDTGFTQIGGNISSYVPATDSLTMSGSGILGLAGASVIPIATITTSSPNTPIMSITESTGTSDALVATSAAHNLVVGQTVVIQSASVGGYNGTFSVSSVPTSTTFTYTAGAAGLPSSTGGTLTANLATVTTTVPHSFQYGQAVVIAQTGNASSATSAPVTAYNGAFTVLTTPGANVYTFSGPSIVAGLAAVSGGAVSGQANPATGVGGNTFDGVVTVNSGRLLDVGRQALGLAGRNSQQSLQINTSSAMTNASVTTSTPAITSATTTGTTASIVTALTHNFVVGESVTVSGSSNPIYNGTFTVTGTPSSTSFTYALAGNPGPSTGGTATGTLATISTAAAHNLAPGMRAIIAGSSVAAYNTSSLGAPILSVPSATKFTLQGSAGVAAGTGGTVNPGSQAASISSITESGTTATVTTSAPHGYQVGQQIQIAGANYAQAISSITENGNVATVTTAAAHGFSAGDNVTIANASSGGYNGTFHIVAVPSTTTFTYELGTLGLPDATAGTATVPMSASIASTIETGATVMVTTVAPNSFQAGQTIIIGGASVSGYDGVYTIASVIDSRHFTYASPTSGRAPSDKGSVLLVVAYNQGYNGTYVITGVPSPTTFTYTAIAGLSAASTGSAYPINNTFTVSFSGQTTIPVPFNASATTLQTALAGLSSIGIGNVSVGGGPGGSVPYAITFQGVLGYSPQPNITANGANLAGGPKSATPNVAFGALPIVGLAPGGNVTINSGASLGVSTGVALTGQGAGDGAIYGKTVIANAGAAFVQADNTSPTVTLPIQFANPLGVPNPTVTFLDRMSCSPSFAGPINIGSMNMVTDTTIGTLFFGVSNSTLNPQYNAVSLITSTAGASINNVNIQRATLGSPSPNMFGTSLTATKGVLAESADMGYGPGSNIVTAANNATIGLRAGSDYFTPQAIAIAGTSNLGADLGNGPIGAVANIDGVNTWSGITFNVAAGDIHLGSVGGGNMILTNPLALTGAQKLEINANGGAVSLWSTATIAGPATSGLIKNSAGIINAANGGAISSIPANLNINSSNPGFSGAVTINGGLVNVKASMALGVGAQAITVSQSGTEQGALGITAPTYALTAANVSGGIVTATTASAHGFSVGQQVTIAGVTPASHNGTFTIAAVPTPTTFTYANNASGLVNATGLGTAQGGIDLGTVPLNIAGPGPNSAGAIENISGPNKIGGPITLGGATTIGSDAGALTIGGNIITNPVIGGATTNRLLTFTGAGNTVVNGNILGSAGNALSAGLLETQLNAANSASGPGAPTLGSTIQLTTLMAQTNTVSDTTTAFPTTRHLWSSNDTWIYTGTIFFPNINNGFATAL